MEPLCTEELKGNADVVEFCNIPPYLNLLVAASYTLQEGPVPIRVGGLHVFSVEKKDKNHAAVLLQELQVIETSGVFDIKWRGSSSDLGLLPCLGQASADGSLRLYSLQEGLPPNPGLLSFFWEFVFPHLSLHSNAFVGHQLSISCIIPPVSVGNDFLVLNSLWFVVSLGTN
jgi:hypothetical protein